MQRLKALIRQQKVSGPSMLVHDHRLTPQSHVLIIRFPWGTWVHHRPTALLVERNGHTDYLPIVDRTRRIQLWLFGMGVVISIVSFMQFARRKGNRL
jgi:hypothetical protein